MGKKKRKKESPGFNIEELQTSLRCQFDDLHSDEELSAQQWSQWRQEVRKNLLCATREHLIRIVTEGAIPDIATALFASTSVGGIVLALIRFPVEFTKLQASYAGSKLETFVTAFEAACDSPAVVLLICALIGALLLTVYQTASNYFRRSFCARKQIPYSAETTGKRERQLSRKSRAYLLIVASTRLISFLYLIYLISIASYAEANGIAPLVLVGIVHIWILIPRYSSIRISRPHNYWKPSIALLIIAIVILTWQLISVSIRSLVLSFLLIIQKVLLFSCLLIDLVWCFFAWPAILDVVLDKIEPRFFNFLSDRRNELGSMTHLHWFSLDFAIIGIYLLFAIILIEAALINLFMWIATL